MNREPCLYCYEPLGEEVSLFHPSCSKAFFGSSPPPALEHSNEEMLKLAEEVVKSHTTVPGVQPKLSLGLQKVSGETLRKKLTIVGLWGGFILKPPSNIYRALPELEDLSMKLAEKTGIRTVPHTLLPLASGELSYLTRRIDREGQRKFHMEDMCQLTERLTEQKYHGSHEQIGKAIMSYSVNPGLDIIDFFEQVLVSFLIGNNDMHLKNFSLWKDPEMGYSLSPAYDMIASGLVVEGDDEELALTLNGKKKKLKRADFEEAMGRFQISKKAVDNLFERLEAALPDWESLIEASFLPEDMKEGLRELIERRAGQVGMGI